MASEQTCLDHICEMKQALIAEMHGHICGDDEMPVGKAGSIVDMIKDLAKAEYYCTVVQAMHENPSVKDISDLREKTKAMETML